MALKGRSLLTLLDFSPQEVRELLDLSIEVKREHREGVRKSRFTGRSLAMLFEKRSTRTRCAFETAFGEEGGHPVFLSSADIQLGAKETIEDTARVLGRMFDIIEFRGFEQSTVEKLAEHSGVPVINGLTDMYHPTQALADLMTIEEQAGKLRGTATVFIGDGRNNVSRSLMIGAAMTGLEHTVIAPAELHPAPDFVERLKGIAENTGARIVIETDPASVPPQAAAIYTDVWISMGEEETKRDRVNTLRPYQVTDETMDRAPKAVFLHCLPAVRENEMTASVIDGDRSRVWDQAENRKHTIKAVMLATAGLA